MIDQHDEQFEPGGRLPAPNAALQELQAFVNTNDIEEERDEIGTPAKLHDWLVVRGALGESDRVTSEDQRRAVAVREGLRALGRANNGDDLDHARVDELNAAAATLPLSAGIGDAQAWRLTPAMRGVDGYLAGMVATLVTAMADGTWSRMKACHNDTCRWLFYDSSRNRSGTWCSMAVCGSRLKARAYRARQRESARTPA